MIILGKGGLYKQVLFAIHGDYKIDMVGGCFIGEEIREFNERYLKENKSKFDNKEVFMMFNSRKMRRKTVDILKHSFFPNIFADNYLDTGYASCLKGVICLTSRDNLEGLSYEQGKPIIGDFSVINRDVVLHHDSAVGQFSVLSPGTRLLGGAQVGDNCFLGANVTVLPKVKIGNNCVISAGSVVRYDVPDNTLVALEQNLIYKDIE